MKRLVFLVLVLVCSMSDSANAQLQFGAGANYYNNLGISARAHIGMGSFDLTPKVTYFFSKGSNTSIVDLDGEIDLVRFGDDNPLYALVGAGLSFVSSNGLSSTNLGLNAGVGIEISRIYLEARYSGYFCEACGGDVGFAAGYYF